MSASVLDASAFLAYLQEEPGADQVTDALGQTAVISAANWAEVLTKLGDVGHEPRSFVGELREAGLLGGALEVVPLLDEDAILIAGLRPSTKAAGLSLADRACLALGIRLGLDVLTTDRAWLELDVPRLSVVSIR